MEETTGSMGFSKPVLLGPIGPWLEHGGGKACDLKLMEMRFLGLLILLLF